MSTPYRVTTTFWDHATIWSDDESLAGHTTDGGRVFGITRTRYVECDRYNCPPVAVIAYEDREQVGRLVVLLGEHGWLPTAGHGLRDALREFASPTPRPDEPQGWLAAVEDPHTDQRWYRDGAADTTHRWRQQRDDGIHARNTWDELPRTVRVLSEGVTQ